MKIRAFLFFICLLLYSNLSTAQNFNRDRIPRENNLYVGLGPSFIYSDNGGGVRNLEVKIRPAAFVSYGRKITSLMDIKATLGVQVLESQSINYFEDSTLRRWNREGQAFGMKGTSYHLDVMPIFNLFPFDTHISRQDINVYLGIGVGIMGINKEELRLINNMPDVQNKSMSIPYVPVRGGISYRIGPHSDLGIEGTFMATFSDEIDGNVSFNRFNDYLFQGHIVFKRYLSTIPFWQGY